MMGRIHTAASFRQTLAYCMEDKELTVADQSRISLRLKTDAAADVHLRQPPSDDPQSPPTQRLRQVAFKDRAEVFWYNQCYGNRQDLVRQFNEVARLKLNVSEPVFHISLSLPPGERLPKPRLVDLAYDCARYMDFDRHQFVAVLHKDTAQQHFHLVANRIGFDLHTASDSYSVGRMADFCREAELTHNLIQEPGPRRYLPKEQRLIPRQGIRLDKLKENIRQSLNRSRNYEEFRQQMQEQGYTVYDENRGIAFMDRKNVVLKGSEAGYSLPVIEKTLETNQQLRLQHQLKLQRQQQEEELRQRHRLSHRISHGLGL